MLDIKEVQERIELRLKILENLYSLHFSERQEGFSGTKKEIFVDTETHRAYHYLLLKKYIDITSIIPPTNIEILTLSITPDGIDFIEANALARNETESPIRYQRRIRSTH